MTSYPLPLSSGLLVLAAAGCLASGGSGGADEERRADLAADRDGRLEICVRNDSRLPATVQLFRDGNPVGPPVQTEGFTRSCRSAHRTEMEGTLDTRVDPVGTAGRYFPESLRDIMVTGRDATIVITLVWEGIHPFGQSTYRTRQR